MIEEKHERQADPLLPNKEAAKYIGMSAGTLPIWRHQGKGPDYIKNGGKVLYRRSALDAYLERQTIRVSA